jgi:hypothetical protein
MHAQVSTRSAATSGAADGQSAMQTPNNAADADHSASTAGKAVAKQSDMPYLLMYNGILAVGW